MSEITGITTKPPKKKKGSKRVSAVKYIRLYDHLTRLQTDVLGEVANISMGNSATTLSMMLNHPVNITAPCVEVIHRSDALEGYEGTCTFVQIHYIKGLSGSNVFVLKDADMLADPSKLIEDIRRLIRSPKLCTELANNLHEEAKSDAASHLADLILEEAA